MRAHGRNVNMWPSAISAWARWHWRWGGHSHHSVAAARMSRGGAARRGPDSDMEAAQRGSSPPFATLTVKVVLLNIIDIDTEAQEFAADVLVEARARGQAWLLADGREGGRYTKDELLRDPRNVCTVIPETHVGKRGNSYAAWHSFLSEKLNDDLDWNYNPNLEVLNIKDASLVDGSGRDHAVDGGDAVFKQRWKGTFTEEFELQDFPFDIQVGAQRGRRGGQFVRSCGPLRPSPSPT
jgi:hypothetical protein